ncbi:hypothetical protein SODALDRAFT_377445 [Sodiomyces alkalinus F11]|uniref:Uncharacterized protein n=1 Tax=Sodiomyces alkalinus (strain CBS 110278 / VKM F-3762 / F11) TaxID=1314773 RepID=A0A3N2PYB2_SODAK|nr:hypothetical protein SODALDRAFT_377445 [Sodiomyces alkalinus F11]ROT39487.1 hypothetical protein SODALDRAFT_377445 [Sodiomyces alkalinus F11]
MEHHHGIADRPSKGMFHFARHPHPPFSSATYLQQRFPALILHRTAVHPPQNDVRSDRESTGKGIPPLFLRCASDTLFCLLCWSTVHFVHRPPSTVHRPSSTVCLGSSLRTTPFLIIYHAIAILSLLYDIATLKLGNHRDTFLLAWNGSATSDLVNTNSNLTSTPSSHPIPPYFCLLAPHLLVLTQAGCQSGIISMPASLAKCREDEQAFRRPETAPQPNLDYTFQLVTPFAPRPSIVASKPIKKRIEE